MSSIKMAEVNGIRISHVGQYGEYTRFHPICIKCGNECSTSKYETGVEYVCAKCKAKEKKESNDCRKIRTLESAIRKLKSNIHTKKIFNEYREAIETVRAMLDSGLKLDSKEEAMVAIQLVKDNVIFETQKTIAGHKVDFALNDYHIILEIDGVTFHTDWDKDNQIDERVKSNLDGDWEIIRITDENVNFYIPALLDALKCVLSERESKVNYHRYYDYMIVDEVMFNRCYGEI